MASRLQLQSKLETTLGARHVYYQPPSTIKMVYPAIRYELRDIDTVDADDINYLKRRSYTVTLIDNNPDSQFVDLLIDYEYCSFDRVYETDNLYHFVFTLYF